MIGLGLVEQIHPADILARADPDDRDGDGISGKASIVRDGKSGELTLGRFGWKASRRRSASRRPRPSPATSAFPIPMCRNPGATAPMARPLAAPCRPACRSGSATPRRPIRCSTSSPSIRRTSPCRRAATSDKPEVLHGKKVFLRSRLRLLPHAEIRDAPRRAEQGAEIPADLALFRFPAARHGRGPGRRPAGRRRDRQRNGARRRSGASG